MLDTPPESAFDRLTKLVSAVLNVPVVLLSLVDEDRQFFKSQCGLPEPWATARQTPLTHSFCQHVAGTGESLVIPDARDNPLVRDNLAIPDLGVIAYAGVPVVDGSGFVLGSFCAIDTKPRSWSDEDVNLLRAFSAQVTSEIELRSQSQRLAKELANHQAREADRRTMVRLHVHDLRTPLSAMLLGLDAFKMLGPLSEDQEQLLAVSRRSGDALLNIIDNLLDIETIDQRGPAALNLHTCNAATVIAPAIEQVQPLAKEKSIRLDVKASDSMPSICVDVDKIVRTLVNLLANAVKFTSANGRVTLEVQASADASGPCIRFAVIDTGIGINTADAAHIFDEGVHLDPTATTRRSTGLGLTFCKRIVEAHGGEIWVQSAIGSGSTFAFTLPAKACN